MNPSPELSKRTNATKRNGDLVWERNTAQMSEETELLSLQEALGRERVYPDAAAAQRTGYYTLLEGRAQGLT